jgi:CheY-like chemotaxis protein
VSRGAADRAHHRQRRKLDAGWDVGDDVGVQPLRPTRRVLVVEDQASIAALLNEFLRVSGYAVKIATTGEEGLDHVAAFQPDLVVLDLTLPGMMGTEVLDRLREIRPDLAVIATPNAPRASSSVEPSRAS